jgi:hypothetical protein
MTAIETTLYKASFDHTVVVEGAVYGGLIPFKAAYLTTGEGPFFRRVPADGYWDTIDIRLYDCQFDDSKSQPIKLTITTPKGWHTSLLLALIVYHVRGNDTLRFYSEGARIHGLFEWFVQDPNAVANFLGTQHAFDSIESKTDTHLS